MKEYTDNDARRLARKIYMAGVKHAISIVYENFSNKLTQEDLSRAFKHFKLSRVRIAQIVKETKERGHVVYL